MLVVKWAAAASILERLDDRALLVESGQRQGILFQPRMDRAEKAPDALASLARYRLRTAMPTCPLFPGVRRPTDADPASDPGTDETVTSRPVDLYHARPRSLDGSDARPDKAGASGVLTCSPSPSLIFYSSARGSPGAHSHHPCAPPEMKRTGISVPPQLRCGL